MSDVVLICECPRISITIGEAPPGQRAATQSRGAGRGTGRRLRPPRPRPRLLRPRRHRPRSHRSRTPAGRRATTWTTQASAAQGLIEQLEFEGYPTEAATVAVDSLTVDWNAEAGESARSYLDFQGFSQAGLVDQLVFEGFTPEQANQGATVAKRG